jgi:phosphoribosylformylglycinamidine synthase
MERAVQQCCLKAIERGIIRSAHDIAEGGLAVALTECCVGGPEKPLGVKVDLPEMMRPDARLFGESQSRIIVSVKERDLGRLEAIAQKEGVPVQALGEVGGSRFVIQPLIQLAVDELKSIWSGGLERRLQ